MCFSVEVEKNLLRIAKRFKAEISFNDVAYYRELQAKANDYNFVKSALNLKRRPTSPFFKEPKADNRIYPGYFSDVIVNENGSNLLKKMRYRIRPANSEEIPAKFDVFNARIDSLDSKQAWKRVFMRQHGLFPFMRFFEWVEVEGHKKLISFAPKDRELMWAPCLWDYWQNQEGTFGFYSFTIITDDPPAEVSEMGHDRCPIFLREEMIDAWLNPAGKSKEEIFEILKSKEKVKYINEWAA